MNLNTNNTNPNPIPVYPISTADTFRKP